MPPDQQTVPYLVSKLAEVLTDIFNLNILKINYNVILFHHRIRDATIIPTRAYFPTRNCNLNQCMNMGIFENKHAIWHFQKDHLTITGSFLVNRKAPISCRFG